MLSHPASPLHLGSASFHPFSSFVRGSPSFAHLSGHSGPSSTLAALSAHLTSDFVLEFRPASAFKAIPGFPEDGKVHGVEPAVRWWRSLAQQVMKEVQGADTHRLIEDANSVVHNLTFRAIASDGKPYEHELVHFYEFEPGTDKIKRVVEYMDSVYVNEIVKRTGLTFSSE
ncbi:hypothetical protein JCM8097_005621 [Rhodosporidiobolus ruineniae]